MKIYLFSIAFYLGFFNMRAQTVVDSILPMHLFQFHGGFHEPGGDMAELYGTHAFIGFSYAYKTKNNFLLGSDFSFLFGNNVNDPNGLFRELRLSNGGVVGIDAEFVNFLVQERGYLAGLYIGKIFPIIGPNPNSGLVVKLGVDYLEHRTRIETREDEFPPLEGEYLKGYDRKRAGFALYEFIGYQHFSNTRFANFYAGMDVYQGFTTDYRSYNFDEMKPTDGNYFDVLLGFRIGWVIPVYRQTATKFYVD